MVLHQLIDELTADLNLTPEQQFRVTAKIKRLIHHEKAGVYHRYSMYAQGEPIFGPEEERDADGCLPVIGHEEPRDPWLHKILSISYKNHQNWASKPDEEIVTWDVGTHKFVQGAKK